MYIRRPILSPAIRRPRFSFGSIRSIRKENSIRGRASFTPDRFPRTFRRSPPAVFLVSHDTSEFFRLFRSSNLPRNDGGTHSNRIGQCRRSIKTTVRYQNAAHSRTNPNDSIKIAKKKLFFFLTRARMRLLRKRFIVVVRTRKYRRARSIE